MKTITKEYKIYEFNELSEKAKNKAIEWYRNACYEDELPFLFENMQYHLEELLKKNRMKCSDSKVYYDLSYSQGSGAMFIGTVQWKSYIVNIKHYDMYCHHNSKEFTIESAKTSKEARAEVYAEFNELYVNICKQLERLGYQYIEDYTSDDSIADTFQANEYEFLEDGTIF